MNVAILATKNTNFLETESANLPPIGLSSGSVIVGIAVIRPTSRVEFVWSKTYQLTIIPLVINTEKPNPLAIK